MSSPGDNLPSFCKPSLLERIAHRGAKLELPENSIEAFVRALDRGADAIELDVHATRDGVLIVHHDPSIRLPGRVLRTPIVESTWREIATVQLAPGIGVPTLEAVLDSLPSDRTAYVEIKGLGLANLVAPAIGHDPRCVVHSFDIPTIAKMRELAPHLPRGILFEHGTPDVRSLMAETGARDVWPEWPLIDQTLIDLVHDAGGRVIAWTVNDPKVAKRLVAAGVDGVCTDDVRLLAWDYQGEQSSPADRALCGRARVRLLLRARSGGRRRRRRHRWTDRVGAFPSCLLDQRLQASNFGLGRHEIIDVRRVLLRRQIGGRLAGAIDGIPETLCESVDGLASPVEIQAHLSLVQCSLSRFAGE